MSLTINTNLASMMVQMNLSKSTFSLDKAIEQLTTGFRINHASDNAANYSIATNMVSELSSLDVVSQNVAMGADLVSTAQSILDVMSNNASRLQALSIQARNGTYGNSSLSAMNTEAASIVANLMMQYSNAEYNGISLFDRVSYMVDEWLPSPGESGFIDEGAVNSEPIGTTGNVGTTGTVGLTEDISPKYNGFIADPTARDSQGNAIDVDSLTSVAGLSDFSSQSAYKITSKAELEHFRDLVNAGKDTTGKTFYLAADIDLGVVAENVTNWTPIGYYTDSTHHNEFKGTFDGNGHKITNMSIYAPETDYQGLFGGRVAEGSTIKNVGVEGRVTGKDYTGGLVSYLSSSNQKQSVIENCYSNVEVSGQGSYTGGLVGCTSSYTNITDSYATGSVTGRNSTGGLVGQAVTNSSISNSYATGTVTGRDSTGGLVGWALGSISNSYATGSVTGQSNIGGLVGQAGGSISNSYATGSVTGNSNFVGGLVGQAISSSRISSSYATGSVTGKSKYTGGLVGSARGSISNSYATGGVTGQKDSTGGLVGQADTNSSISNSYATGSVTGQGQNTGGLVGLATTNSRITNSYATSSVTGQGQYTGGLVGYANTSSNISNSYATGFVTGQASNTGGLVGYANGSISNSYATGTVTGKDYTGGLAGTTSTNNSITNSYATGFVTGQNQTGGLVGNASGSITNSYAIGTVTGRASIGGLVGNAHCSITNSFAKGSVTGQYYTGGLVGSSGGSITNSYATGPVTGQYYTGGLVGASGGNITNSFAKGDVSGNNSVGGLVGEFTGYDRQIDNCYSGGRVSGNESVGGFIGKVGDSGDASITVQNSVSYSKVNGTDKVGSFIGGYIGSYNDYFYYEEDDDEYEDEYTTELTLNNCKSAKLNGLDMIGGYYTEYYSEIEHYDEDEDEYSYETSDEITLVDDYDMSSLLSEISEYELMPSDMVLQVGTKGDSSNQITFDSNFSLDVSAITNNDIGSDAALNAINKLMNILNTKSTELGAISNRLDSVSESIITKMNNYTASLSTIRDADVAKVSSQYIRSQILQQAAATLLATANQSPSIALQLL